MRFSIFAECSPRTEKLSNFTPMCSVVCYGASEIDVRQYPTAQRLSGASRRTKAPRPALLSASAGNSCFYRSIGRDILARQDAEGWGAKVIDRLAKDLGTEFPGVEGFSPRNLNICEAWLQLGRTRQ